MTCRRQTTVPGRTTATCSSASNVDGSHGVDVTADLGRTATLDALDYAIRHLAALRTQLADLYGDRAPSGQCLETGDWGRCTGYAGHDDGAHTFPTQRQWERFRADIRQGKTRGSLIA